jgi:hypothetical protein
MLDFPGFGSLGWTTKSAPKSFRTFLELANVTATGGAVK